MIVRALAARDDEEALGAIREEAEALAMSFPMPGIDD